MKYLKLYETVEQRSLQEYLKKYTSISTKDYLDCSNQHLTSLKGIEDMVNLVNFKCNGNKLTNLNGIENCVELRKLEANNNLLTDVKSLSNLINLENLHLMNNQLEDVSCLANLINLKGLYLKHNKLTNIDFIFNFNNLEGLSTIGNDWEYPFPLGFYRRFDLCYSDSVERKFSSYEYQRKVLDEHPEKAKRLEGFFCEKIIEEYGDLLDFFNIKY